MTQKAKKPMWRRVLAWIGGMIGAVLLAALFYVTVALGQPQKDLAHEISQDQPLLTPSPAVTIPAGQGAETAAAVFPVPVLCCTAGGELTLTGGTSYDTAFENGVARILTLNYTSAQGEVLQVTSIYPVRALALIADESWRLNGAGPSLAGNSAVQMEKDGQVRLHAQSETGLYVVTAGQLDQERLRELVRPLQLLGGAETAP